MSERTSTRENGDLMTTTTTKADGGRVPASSLLQLLVTIPHSDFLPVGRPTGVLSRGRGSAVVGLVEAAPGHPPVEQEGC